tara:strand:+ start:275 stop:481 length:207 start_codon:yes stop_codon:yes gene_type:complete
MDLIHQETIHHRHHHKEMRVVTHLHLVLPVQVVVVEHQKLVKMEALLPQIMLVMVVMVVPLFWHMELP